MKAVVEIDAGVCGFKTSARASSEDSRHVTFEVTSDCENIRRLAAVLKNCEPLDAYQEISPAGQSMFMVCVHAAVGGGVVLVARFPPGCLRRCRWRRGSPCRRISASG